MAVRWQRVCEMLRETTVFLARQSGPTHKRDVFNHLDSSLDLTEEERQTLPNGMQAWADRLDWMTTNLVKAGWITKDGSGIWEATDEGRAALERYPDSESFGNAQDAAYKAWEKANPRMLRRGWLVRGSSVLGVNLVPEWLVEGYSSLAGSQLRPIEAGIEADQLREIAAEDYAHLKHHELKAKVDEIVSFITKMHAGDVVLTTSDENVYVGDLVGDWSYRASEGGRANLRRAVEWRNEDAPIDFADLPTPLPARLQAGSTILDLTADLALIEALTEPELEAEGDGDSVGVLPSRPPRHEHLPEPTQALADELFVSLDWLAEVRSLLDERRQVIFYGPPGTGKTYIARKLAADLVGPEQVKLVQFHPAYTYEDFFEGYRPSPGTVSGTISFELKAGPLRQLVDRAREHPDQAFVLIIDEINRANLAKVFGELYFLLEYRDQAVDLLYSADEEGFTLPKNVYLIGTMNTADRSIALVDAAMRRRFAFFQLHPDQEPTKSLLGKWSAFHGLGTTAADLLVALNARIEDPDFRIGPSYFMTSTAPDAHSPARLARTWKTSILPLLEEHHYGKWDSVHRGYRLSSLLASIGAGEPPVDDVSAPNEFASIEPEGVEEP